MKTGDSSTWSSIIAEALADDLALYRAGHSDSFGFIVAAAEKEPLFLPILGLWMLPLGLLLLALDLAFLQGPVNSAVLRLQRKWTLWRRRRKARSAAG